MKKLLSLPLNLVQRFHELENLPENEWFCTADPPGCKLGSGGGTTWLLEECFRSERGGNNFFEWLSQEKRILLHAGGQSRRLPAYAPSGKVLTPVPVFRWARGQRLSQNLLSLQMPLYERIMGEAPESLHTLVASGDVLIRCDASLPQIPEADVVCFGLWVDPMLAKNHGVFLSSREVPGSLDFMLQKPSVEVLAGWAATHYSLMDIGIWLLSDRAVELLSRRSYREGRLSFYDLYSDFGCALGLHPGIEDAELNALSVAILPLPGGEFYHYGTSRELISSTLSIQNLVNDQRDIMHRRVKPHAAMFVQNAVVDVPLLPGNGELWIENSHVSRGWKLSERHLVTGVPRNDWSLTLPAGVCVDVVPYGDTAYVARPYGMNDAFKGNVQQAVFCGMPLTEWLALRGIECSLLEPYDDMQGMPLFPVCSDVNELGKMSHFMIDRPDVEEYRSLWLALPRLSADEISASARMDRLYAQRESFRDESWMALSRNYKNSVFYQCDLKDAAQCFVARSLPLPLPLPADVPVMTRMHDAMFRAEVSRLKGDAACGAYEREAFGLLRDAVVASLPEARVYPRCGVYPDQIVWGRSPVRIDLAGGWTDTPPYCMLAGGSVLNMAVDLNGQPPIQVYVKRCKELRIVMRSIDLGAEEHVTDYAALEDFARVGSPFSIPKAALALAGFVPRFSAEKYASLQQQLQAFGSGIEVTLLAAIPAGSGMGTSSILAATVLGALADFCSLAWDKVEIARRTMVLEQLLTTGGGWQDQYGGVLHGIKLLQTVRGAGQLPVVRWLPDTLFTDAEYRPCHLLYYTGITRVAKNILAEIVRGMFLNSAKHLSMLEAMKIHASELYEAVLRNDFDRMGRLVGRTWEQNKLLDSGTNPPEVERIIEMIAPYTLGYKLPGAGGGGYLYMVARDPSAAARIRSILDANKPNDRARFVDMSLSRSGLQVSRS